ncbi:MAG: sulfatase, partial [Acidobacteria bacterium]|nr:sulfatase [Acidobacteriota bacterium]
SEGVIFRNTIANSAVCCPARAVLLTGEYCHRNGMTANDLRLRENSVSIAKVLRQEGYRTGFIGKWHLDGGPRLPGFVPPGPRRQGYEFWAAHECHHSYFKTHYFRDTPVPIPVRKYEPEAWVDVGLEFLEASRKDKRPFALSIYMSPPHDPYIAPENYMKMYDPAKIAMRPNWKAGDRVPGRKEIAAYYAAVTAIDDQVARLMKALDDFGMAEDTIVLFASDHGDMLGSQGTLAKRKPWEESIHVPGIIRYPRYVKPGRSEDGLFCHIAIPPTLLGLCGAPIPKQMQGTNLSQLVLGKSHTAPSSAFLQIFGPFQGDRTVAGWRGVRTQRYTYARFREKPWVLYDLKEDPYEQHNLVEDHAAASLLKEMDGEVDRWMKRTGDSWNYDWTELVEDDARLYKDRTYYSVEEYLKATK